VEASSEGSKALSRVREAFMAEFEQSKEVVITPVIKTCANLLVHRSSSISPMLSPLNRKRHLLFRAPSDYSYFKVASQSLIR
jgi:hypothetical protein